MKSNSSLSLSGSSLAAVESLSMPLVCIFSPLLHALFHKVHFQLGPTCDLNLFQKQFQEVVLSSDIRCSGCQSRLADMMSKMGGKLLKQPSFF